MNAKGIPRYVLAVQLLEPSFVVLKDIHDAAGGARLVLLAAHD